MTSPRDEALKTERKKKAAWRRLAKALERMCASYRVGGRIPVGTALDAARDARTKLRELGEIE